MLPTVFFTTIFDIYFPGTQLNLYHICMEQWPSHISHTVTLSFKLRDASLKRAMIL